MKTKYFTGTLKRALFSIAALACFAGCGGGGSGGGGPSQSPYVAVTSVSPTANLNTVDAATSSISANFSATLDLTAFVTQGTALSRLLSSKGIKVYNLTTQAVVDPVGLTLPLLTSGQYTVLTKVNGQDQQTTLQSYTYVKESSGAYGLSIALNTYPATSLNFTSAELLNSGVINSSLFTVKDGAGNLAYGEVTVQGSRITFVPLNYLNWSTTYTVTISKAVKDVDGRPLQNDYTWSFSTKAAPIASIDGASPVGIDANPIQKIWVRPNFTVTSLAQDAVILKKVDRTGSDQPAVKTQIEATLSYDKTLGQIVVTPNQPLLYLQEYEVTVRAGLSGNQGNLTGITLANDYVFSFTTSEPKVVAVTPSSSASDLYIDTVPTIEFNFKPELSTLASGIMIVDARNNNIPFTPTVSNGLVKLTPKSALNYDTTYTVTATPNVRSGGTNPVGLASNYSFSFTTVKRKIISTSPTANSTGNSASVRITVGFNFDAVASAFNSSSNFKVEQQTNGFYQTVPGSVFYNSATRTVEFSASQDYLYSSTVRVTVGAIPSVDGAVISQGAVYTFAIQSKNLDVAGKQPSAYATSVPLSTEISVQMSYPVDPATITSSALRVSCGGYSVSGSITYDTYGIYFLPKQALGSFANCTVTVDQNIRGTKNETQNSQTSWQFTTDGLKVKSVAVTYAYGDFVDTTAPIEITFNYPVSYINSGDIYLVDSRTNAKIYGSSYRYGNTVEFTPNRYLDYGQDYTLVVTTNVIGSFGERLQSSTSTYFYTENMPLDVYDYGPTDVVYVDDYYWVEMSNRTTSPGFPSKSGSISSSTSGAYSPYSSVKMEDSGYDVFMTPYSVLSYDADYTIKFNFTYSRGTMDNFNFSWNVVTETDPALAASATRAKAQSVKGGNRSDRSTLAGRNARGCRANKSCIGSLKTKTKAEYKKALSGKRKVDIASKASQDLLKARRAARAR